MAKPLEKEEESPDGTGVPWPRDTKGDKPYFMTGDPDDKGGGEGGLRIGIDPRISEAEFLKRYAAYRNEIAKARGKKLRKQWTRKMLAESFLSAHILEVREQLDEMFKACGELPDPADHVALRRYVAKVIAWDKKMEKDGK